MGNHGSSVYECTSDDSTSDGDCIEQNIKNGQGVEDDCDNQGKQKTGDVTSAITIPMTGTCTIVAAVSLTVLPTTTRAMTTMLPFEISATTGYSNPNAAATPWIVHSKKGIDQIILAGFRGFYINTYSF